ncbi:putative metallopeptidase [Bradyrhizobium ivorense]|uniref:putative metallopeptidase n=1 Tax=Bradyrhizobium ivorense TaxID=2511166 RepID=UPI001FCEEF07|nr:putative metallopeptidase [Bradyrhizobium ivorense]
MFKTFINEGSPLTNADHAHLSDARIGVLWTSVENGKHGRAIVGQAQLCGAGGSDKWAKGRIEQQLTEWFGSVPDFVITLFAPFAAQANDATFCALVEHELSHCAQEVDEFGSPKFTRNGPSYCMRGHDIEEFVGVVARYGADASGVRALVDAANAGPTIAAADITFACGNCQR